MWKKFLAASAVASGIIGLLGAGDAFATIVADSYTPGQEISLSTNYDVCVQKNGGYDGDLIIADIRGTNYEKQIVFDSFTTNWHCVSVENIPSGSKLKFVTPMGLNRMMYTQSNSSTRNEVILDLGGAIGVDGYLRSYGQAVAAIKKSRVVSISFDANGGSGEMSSTVGVVNTSMMLPRSTLTREGYRFVGWNTRADGTGVSYADGATISFAEIGEIRLYAQWAKRAVLDSGKSVNRKLRSLAGEYLIDSDTLDRWCYRGRNEIKMIKNADALPTGFVARDENTISADSTTSLEPIYAWFDDSDKDNDGEGDGIIYLYTDAGTIEGGADMSSMLCGMENLLDVSTLASWDVSNVTNMSHMFDYDRVLTDISALASWDVSKATSVSNMFRSADSLTDISALASWDVSNVYNMSGMFSQLSSLTDISALASWDTSSVTNMNSMFDDARSLTDISSLSDWNTSSVTDMGYMFSGIGIVDVDALETKLHEGNDYVSWDVSNVIDMSHMFDYDRVLTDISALASWDVSKATIMNDMFRSADSLTDISALASWNISGAKDLSWMLTSVYYLSDISPLAGWDVSEADIGGMFANVTALSDISPLANWNTSKVKQMGCLFWGATSLVDISPLSDWDTSSVTNMSHMFDNTSISSISPLAGWDTSNVESMWVMFSGVSSLTDISDLSGWNTSNVTNMWGMFEGTGITNVDALRTVRHEGNDYVSWDTSNVTYMREMFKNATSLTNVSALESWDTSNVTSMQDMFLNVPATPLPSWYHN